MTSDWETAQSNVVDLKESSTRYGNKSMFTEPVTRDSCMNLADKIGSKLYGHAVDLNFRRHVQKISTLLILLIKGPSDFDIVAESA